MKNYLSYNYHFIVISVLFAIAAATLFFRSPYNASNLDVIPDAVEYAFGAFRIVNNGTFDIILNGQSYPSRYPPWFSLFILAPSYFIFGLNVGNAILPVLFFSVCGTLFAFWAGCKIADIWGGVCAASFVLFMPLYKIYAMQVMSDVPCTALIVAVYVLYLQMVSKSIFSYRYFFCAGTLIALAYSIRMTSASAFFPFIVLLFNKNKPQRLPGFFILLLPLFCIVAANSWYSKLTFGSAFRTGYHYWCSIPFDYNSLPFSINYINNNLAVMFRSGILIYIFISIIALIIMNRRTPLFRDIFLLENKTVISSVTFVLMTTCPIILFHLVYFYPDTRFFLSVAVLWAVLAGGLYGRLLQQTPLIYAHFLIITVTCTAFFIKFNEELTTPVRRISAENIFKFVPQGAVVISDIDPAYLELMVGVKKRMTFLPLNRNVEYASKYIVRQRIPQLSPAPLGWWDHRCAGLALNGAEEAFSKTADEAPDEIESFIRCGMPVFLLVGSRSKPDAVSVNDLKKLFILKPIAKNIFQLLLRKGNQITSPPDI